jgi:hypothetical protein
MCDAIGVQQPRSAGSKSSRDIEGIFKEVVLDNQAVAQLKKME